MIRKLLLGCLAALSVTGCSENIKERLGLATPSPDEYRVTSHAPLAVPPEFDLKPPMPGAPSLTVVQPADTGEALLTGRDPNAEISASNLPQQSEAEMLLLQQAGANRADPTIREDLTREALEAPKEKKKQSWFNRLIGRDEEKVEKEAEQEPLKEIKRKPKIDTEAAPTSEPAAATPANVPAELPEPTVKTPADSKP